MTPLRFTIPWHSAWLAAIISSALPPNTTAQGVPGDTVAEPASTALIREELRVLLDDLEIRDADDLFAQLQPPTVEDTLDRVVSDAVPSEITQRDDYGLPDDMFEAMGHWISGDYAAALEMTKYRLNSEDSQAPSWVISDLRGRRRMLERILSLSETDRLEVTEVFQREQRFRELSLVTQSEEGYAMTVDIARRRLRLLGADADATATALNNIGAVLRAQRQCFEAELFHRAALCLRLRILGPDHPFTALTLRAWGHTLVDQHDYPRACQAYCAAIEIYASRLAPDHIKVRQLLRNLGHALERRGQFVPAERALRYDLMCTRHDAGADSAAAAAALMEVSQVVRAQGRYQEASHLIEECVGLRRKHNPASIELALSLQSLGNARLVLDDCAGAERAFSEALTIHTQILGYEHHGTSDYLNSLGVTYSRWDYGKEAERCFRESLSNERRTLDPHHPRIAYTLRNLALELLAQDRLNEARQAASEALAIQRLASDQDHQHIALALSAAAQIAMKSREPNEAVRLSREAYEQCHQGAPPLYLAGAARALAAALLARAGPGDVEEAGSLLKQCVDLSRALGLATMVPSLTDYGRYLEAYGDAPDAAADLYQEAIDWAEQRTKRSTAEGLDLARDFSILRGGGDPYGALARVLIDKTAPSEAAKRRAMEIVERAHASALVRLIETRHQAASQTPPGRLAGGFPGSFLGERDLLLLYQFARSDLVALAANAERILSAEVQSSTPDQPLVAALSRRREQIEAGGSFEQERVDAAYLGSCIAGELSGAARVWAVLDGPLHQLPMESLALDASGDRLWIDASPPVIYGPSAHVLAMKQHQARAATPGDARTVALGDPRFRAAATGLAKGDAEVPDQGVLIARVLPNTNAARAGAKAGDVLLSYNGTALRRADDLRQAIDRQPSGEVPARIWRSGVIITASLQPGPLGVHLSQSEMPRAIDDWRELQLSQDQRTVKHGYAATRDGFGDLLPLPGTRVEVEAIGRVMKEAGADDDAVRILTGDEATLTNLFNAAEKPPRFLHLATHGIVHEGRRVYDSALALAAPENPTPDDFGFLRLQDLLEKWGGRLDGTELVVLSGCQTATGRLEAGDGFVGLTWGFLYAGAESVIASLWKVDDAATALLMTRLYENLLGTYDEPRGWRLDPRTGRLTNPPPKNSHDSPPGDDRPADAVRDHGVCPPGAPMPKAEALHEAKRWLRSRTPAENKARLAELGFDVAALEKSQAEARGRRPSGGPVALSEPFDYSHPRYWAAFILIGSPD